MQALLGASLLDPTLADAGVAIPLGIGASCLCRAVNAFGQGRRGSFSVP